MPRPRPLTPTRVSEAVTLRLCLQMGLLPAAHPRTRWCWVVVLIMAAASTSSVASVSLDRALLQNNTTADEAHNETGWASKGWPMPQLRAAVRGGGAGGASEAAGPLQQPSKPSVHTINVTRDPAVLSRLPGRPDVASMSFNKVRLGVDKPAAEWSRQAGGSPQQAAAHVGNTTAHTVRSGSTVDRRAAATSRLPGTAPAAIAGVATPILRQGPPFKHRPYAANATVAAAGKTPKAAAAAAAMQAAAAAQAAAVFSGTNDVLFSGQCLETSAAQTSCLQSPENLVYGGVWTMCLLPGVLSVELGWLVL